MIKTILVNLREFRNLLAQEVLDRPVLPVSIVFTYFLVWFLVRLYNLELTVIQQKEITMINFVAVFFLGLIFKFIFKKTL